MGRALGRKPSFLTVVGKAAQLHNAGLTPEKIAEIMAVQPGTVIGYLSRAKHRGLIEANKTLQPTIVKFHRH